MEWRVSPGRAGGGGERRARVEVIASAGRFAARHISTSRGESRLGGAVPDRGVVEDAGRRERGLGEPDAGGVVAAGENRDGRYRLGDTLEQLGDRATRRPPAWCRGCEKSHYRT